MTVNIYRPIDRPFIELHKEDDGAPLMIGIANICDIYKHSEVGCIIGFSTGDNSHHVLESYEEIAEILNPYRHVKEEAASHDDKG